MAEKQPIVSLDTLKIILKGIFVGIANAIPGVSGGTIAFILGIYEELIYSIKCFDQKLLGLLLNMKFNEALRYYPWKFFVPLMIGVITAILSSAHLIVWLLENRAVYVNSFFFGLILATIPIIILVIKKWDIYKVLQIIFASMVTYMLSTLMPVTTPESLWFIFICGAVSICTMILPGISGAYVLVILGKYQYIIDAVHQRNLVVLTVFIAGMIIGIAFFVRILNWLFKKFHDQTMAVLSGVVIGSLAKIWPWKKITDYILDRNQEIIPLKQVNILPVQFGQEAVFCLLLMLLGLVVALIFYISGSHKK